MLSLSKLVLVPTISACFSALDYYFLPFFFSFILFCNILSTLITCFIDTFLLRAFTYLLNFHLMCFHRFIRRRGQRPYTRYNCIFQECRSSGKEVLGALRSIAAPLGYRRYPLASDLALPSVQRSAVAEITPSEWRLYLHLLVLLVSPSFCDLVNSW